MDSNQEKMGPACKKLAKKVFVPRCPISEKKLVRPTPLDCILVLITSYPTVVALIEREVEEARDSNELGSKIAIFLQFTWCSCGKKPHVS